jgi:hypothetical protein
LIADAAVLSGGKLAITGKGYGTTNLIVLDRTGAVLMDHSVVVQGPPEPDVTLVYRAFGRKTYTCTPKCAWWITLGDDDNNGSSGSKDTSGVGSISSPLLWTAPMAP